MAFENEIAPNEPTTNPTLADGRHQLRMAHLESHDVPRQIVDDIFREAQESSLVLRVGRRVPVGYGETIIRVDGVEPEVGQVGVGTRPQDREGYAKPVSGVSWGHKSFGPIKLATIVTASAEWERTNPLPFYRDLQSKMSRAIGRGVDLAVFHIRRPDTGAPLLGTELNSYVNATPNRIWLSGDIYTDIMTGYTMLAESDTDLSLFAADERVRPQFISARDHNGNQVFQSRLNLADQFDSIAGVRVEYGKAVPGRIGASRDTGVRMFAGDFSQIVYGYADAITLKRTDVGTIEVDGQQINLWQTNQVAYLVEVTFGWLVNDPTAFVAYEMAPPPHVAAAA